MISLSKSSICSLIVILTFRGHCINWHTRNTRWTAYACDSRSHHTSLSFWRHNEGIQTGSVWQCCCNHYLINEENASQRRVAGFCLTMLMWNAVWLVSDWLASWRTGICTCRKDRLNHWSCTKAVEHLRTADCVISDGVYSRHSQDKKESEHMKAVWGSLTWHTEGCNISHGLAQLSE